jgi:hypothetical protein
MRNLNYLLAIAAVLVVIWIVASVTRFIVGAMLHLLLIVAVVLIAIWAIRKLR